MSPVLRVGQGFDVHPFSPDPSRPLVLGGVRFDGPGLAGHSDADVVAHAVTDALLGAAGLGDIGQHFPDTDPSLAGADSIDLLRRSVADVRAAGWEPQNVDCTVVLEEPKLAPRRCEIEALLTETVGAPVTVKGKRSEGLGAIGRAEGIACFAVALVASVGGADAGPVAREAERTDAHGQAGADPGAIDPVAGTGRVHRSDPSDRMPP